MAELHLVAGKCPECASMVMVPAHAETCHCMACGAPISVSSTLQDAEGIPPIAESVETRDIVSDVPREDTAPSSAPASGVVSSAAAALPAFSWKTAPGFVVFGILTYAALYFGIGYIPLEETALKLAIVGSIGFGAAILIWAVLVYPSLFTDDPVLTSSSAISFFNGLFGYIIFGCIWCHNLTIGKKGVSYAVAAVFAIVGIVAGLYLLFAVVPLIDFSS